MRSLIVAGWAVLVISGVAVAETNCQNGVAGCPYTPPKSEPLFDKNRPDPSASHSYGGLHLGVGQAQSTGGGAAGTSYGLGFGMGWRKGLGSWRNVSAGFLLETGSISYRDGKSRRATLSLPVGLGTRIGYGYSLGHGFASQVGLLGGLSQVSYQSEDDSAKYESQSTVVGRYAGLEYVLILLADGLDINFALQWRHFAVDVGKLDIRAGGVTTEGDLGESINLNIPTIQFGLGLPF